MKLKIVCLAICSLSANQEKSLVDASYIVECDDESLEQYYCQLLEEYPGKNILLTDLETFAACKQKQALHWNRIGAAAGVLTALGVHRATHFWESFDVPERLAIILFGTAALGVAIFNVDGLHDAGKQAFKMSREDPVLDKISWLTFRRNFCAAHSTTVGMLTAYRLHSLRACPYPDALENIFLTVPMAVAAFDAHRDAQKMRRKTIEQTQVAFRDWNRK